MSATMVLKRRVTQVLFSGLGGHGNVAFSIVRASAASRTWVNSLLFFGNEPVLDDYLRRCSSNDLGNDIVRSSRGFAWISWLNVISALFRQKPDCILLHSVKLIVPCALFAGLHRIPLVAIEHQANDLKASHEWFVSRLVMRLANAVIVLTPAYREGLERGLWSYWRPEKVWTIPNGIDIERYSRAGCIGDRLPRLIGMASRMTSIKCHNVLIEALARLIARDGPGQWQLTFAGDGESLPALRDLVCAYGLGDEVHFAGLLGEEALIDWFSTLDIYAHASQGETLSTSILQAMAKGLPIVGSDVSGINDLLADGCGLCVPQSAEGFCDAFDRIVREPDTAEALRRKARAKAEAKYSQSTMFDHYQEVLDSICRR